MHLSGDADRLETGGPSVSRAAAPRRAAIQTSGSVSANPGCGVWTSYDASDSARTTPSSATSVSFSPLVPRSMPRKLAVTGPPPAPAASP